MIVLFVDSCCAKNVYLYMNKRYSPLYASDVMFEKEFAKDFRGGTHGAKA